MGEASGHHIVPKKILVNVFWALIVLTILTVVFHELKMGFLAAPVAVVIATAKAYFVMSYFMGLKYDVPTNRLIFLSGFFFLGLLLLFCVLDIYARTQVSSTL
ncbi:MAG: cytochrome C oxidase subunit IV family protein [Bdellovibrio sp.]